MAVSEERRGAHTFVVGASAGGIEALRTLVAQLPRDFPGVVLVVLHVPPAGTSVLPQILERAGDLVARHPEDGEEPDRGHLYVAPPNYHLLIGEDGRLRLDQGPKVHGHRPAIDALFRSAAAVHGRGVAGVVLSGVLDDGTAGLMAIKRAGGATLVQSPDDALYEMMPRSAIDFVVPDVVATCEELGRTITAMASAPPPVGEPIGNGSQPELFIEVDRGASESPQPGDVSGLTCPDCQGALWETDENGKVFYRCRVGHQYAQESFVVAQGDRVEMALWTALRALEERAMLHRRIAGRQRDRGLADMAERYEARADASVEQAIVLRRVLGGFRMEEEEEVETEGAA